MNFLSTISRRNELLESATATSTTTLNSNESAPIAILSLLLLGIFISSIALWWRLGSAWWSNQSFFPPMAARSIQRWGLMDLFFAVASVFLLATLAAGLALRLGVPREALVSGSASSITKVSIATVQLFAIVFVTWFISLRYAISIRAIGWSTQNLLSDIRLGVVVFIMTFPLLTIMMGASTYFFQKAYEHPIIEAIKNDPSSLPMAIWVAVVIAPLIEEFGFRVLLQGYLESVAKGPITLKLLLFGRRRSNPFDSVREMNELEVTELNAGTLQAESVEGDLDYTRSTYSPASFEKVKVEQLDHNIEDHEITSSDQLPWWPVIVSGVLFGLAHFDYGASWLPLIVLGMVLGSLYRITNRIWPSLVVHVCVNGLTMLNLTILTLYGDPSQLP